MKAKEKLHCQISVDDQRITLAVSGHGEFYFEVPNSTLPELDTYDFAVWAVLPFAMRVGKDIHIAGLVSNRVIDSAQTVSNIWEKWVPYHFTRVWITADETTDEQDETSGTLAFYSGGVDSTHSILRAYDREGERVDGLTVHGMDYSHGEESKFQVLLEKMQPFVEKYLNKHLIVRTNLYDLYLQVDINLPHRHLSHLYVLFACGSLFSGYSKYRVAFDHRLDQQYLIGLYSSNMPANRQMRTKNAYLESMDDDVARSAKVRYLAESGLDLTRISICQVASAQPRNCGKCRKCERTKAHFMAVGLEIPDMFIDNSFDPSWSDVLDYRHPGDRLYTADILSEVENAGRQDEFPGYYQLSERYRTDSKLVVHSVSYRYRGSFRLFMLDLLPESTIEQVRRVKRLFGFR